MCWLAYVCPPRVHSGWHCMAISTMCVSSKHNSTRVDEGKEVLDYSRDKSEGAYRSGEGGEELA